MMRLLLKNEIVYIVTMNVCENVQIFVTVHKLTVTYSLFGCHKYFEKNTISL